ncbi:MAG: HDIG domain-containing protein [Bdellovibrionaceae bacterium]|nr:HDIG domain-containing protein [Pseudobdellovibrionaceae bacterium]
MGNKNKVGDKRSGGKLGQGSGKTHSRESLHRRARYIDHSLEFLEWVNELGFERTWLGRAAQRADEVFRVRRLSLLFLFSLGLSFLMFFDFDLTYSYRTGDKAVRDIKSPISFEIVDEVSTEEKRRTAENSIPLVFDYDRSMFDEAYNRIYSGFRRMRDEVRQVQWHRDEFAREEQIRGFFKFKPHFEAALGRPVHDRHFEWLASQKFSPRIENLVVEVLESWSGYKTVEGLERVIPPHIKTVILRELSRGGAGREGVVPTREVRDLLREEDFNPERVAGLKGLPGIDQRTIVNFARSLLSANITLNKHEMESRKQRARDQVLPVVIAIKRNQVIVPEGSIIQPIHATLLREIENQRSHRNRNFTALVSALLIVSFLLVFFSYLRRFTLNRVRVESKDVAIMGVTMVTVVLVTKIFLFVLNATFASRFGTVVPESALLFAAPVAAGAMLAGLLIVSGELVWGYVIFQAAVLGLMLDMKMSFVIVTIVGGLAAARGVYACKTRNDIYRAGVRSGLVNALVILLVLTVERFGDDSFARDLMWSAPAGLISGILSSLVAMMLIPLMESLFNATTDVKLLELSNLNHPLLKEMVVKAPGTYHHSLIVGAMVESAAEEIGANSLLAKVMSYYHDIGKTEHAAYFIENQKPGQNPHDHLSPHMSKTILIAHVKDGVELGMRYKLGKPIIDGIVQHHGTTLIAFFYNRALEAQDESIDQVSEEEFRYPGPKPQFREAALIMLADSIEAASRSLDEPTPVRLQNIVKNIIQRKFMDGQLDECNLTLKDLTLIEEAFIRILLGIYHQRIDYPRKAGGGASERPPPPTPPTTPIKFGSRKGPATA